MSVLGVVAVVAQAAGIGAAIDPKWLTYGSWGFGAILAILAGTLALQGFRSGWSRNNIAALMIYMVGCFGLFWLAGYFSALATTMRITVSPLTFAAKTHILADGIPKDLGTAGATQFDLRKEGVVSVELDELQNDLNDIKQQLHDLQIETKRLQAQAQCAASVPSEVIHGI